MHVPIFFLIVFGIVVFGDNHSDKKKDSCDPKHDVVIEQSTNEENAEVK